VHAQEFVIHASRKLPRALAVPGIDSVDEPVDGAAFHFPEFGVAEKTVGHGGAPFGIG